MLLLFVSGLALLIISGTTQAVTPAPDGGYANGNTAEGDAALLSLTSGFENTAIGDSALLSNTTGSFNTASGNHALSENASGNNNTATGYEALRFNNGNDNTATGFHALTSNKSGTQNTACGVDALFTNTSGDNVRLRVPIVYLSRIKFLRQLTPQMGSGPIIKQQKFTFVLERLVRS
jgi:hypothetical protein